MDSPAALDETLATLRAHGAATADPLRFSLIEAMARRAAGHGGAVRARLDARLAELAAQSLAVCGQAAAQPQPQPPALAPSPGPVADLVAALAPGVSPQETPAGKPRDGGLSRRSAASTGAPPELRSLREFRRSWARLNAEQRLHQAKALVPAKAGPLNSHQLVHQSLSLMRQLSPEYLQHFMAHVDALLWLDGLGGAGRR